ncbi:CoxG family protein [Gephyromycinifex aptenodytis]|uniref:CoxG family protein n=1 Tax=Gephyromycinifex aptenodytis TaxID=2716227 RepID=UPI0014460AD3|nr:SRPBCC domain-containing protein [Gephyromycinifex aptenodytis]
MKLSHTQTVSATPEAMFAAFMDVRKIGRCFPGAAVTSVDGDDFTGHLTTKVGPFTLTYEGEGEMTLRDAENGRAALQASGGEKHGFGRADMAVELQLTATSPGGTLVHLDTLINVYGSPADLGGGLAQRISEPLVHRFLQRMAGEVEGEDVGDDAPLDIGRNVLPGLVASYGRSFGRAFRRR